MPMPAAILIIKQCLICIIKKYCRTFFELTRKLLKIVQEEKIVKIVSYFNGNISADVILIKTPIQSFLHPLELKQCFQ